MYDKSPLNIVIVLLMIYLASCNQREDKVAGRPATDGVEDTSIVNLISTPERFTGRLVRVSGVMVLEFEGDAIYLSAADAERRITKNGISLGMDYAKLGVPEIKPSDPEQLKKAIDKVKILKDMNGKYVVLEGVFDSNSRGHLGLFSGSLNVEQMPRLRAVSKIPNFEPKQ